MAPPPRAGTPVPPSDSAAELQHIADMLGWSIAVTGALALVVVGLLLWLVFGRGPSQRT